jgi:AraC-like DNA-binding protein
MSTRSASPSRVQAFDYRGAVESSLPGQVFVLHPDELHDGRADGPGLFGYRQIYVNPDRIAPALPALTGRPAPLPFARPVTDDLVLAWWCVRPSRGRRSRWRLTLWCSSSRRACYGPAPRAAPAPWAAGSTCPLSSVAAISFRAGFADQAHFTRTFKAAFGMKLGRYVKLCAARACDGAAHSGPPWRYRRNK